MANADGYDFEFLKTRLDGQTLVVSFDRPAELNAINAKMEANFYEALSRAENDERIRVVYLKGEGRVFSAGHDIAQVAEEMFTGSTPATFMGKNWARTGLMLPSWNFTKPLLVGVHGYVGPHANAILLTCDYVIAAEGTRFSFEAAQKMSTGVPYGPYALLPFYFPIRALKKIWLAGGWFDAQQALDLFYVQRVVPPAQLEAECLKHCRYLEGLPHQNQRDNKKGIHQMYELWGLLQMMIPGRDMYMGGEEEMKVLQEHFRIIFEKGVGAAVKQRNTNVDDAVSKL
ncbi:MAG TPA: enoyl-CoA hydratase/isomerase family protein [Nevskiaceae bacterium]|nr:enoyl-CoA hydratase/isomerase family protein [Nevskiaceae bacterium]